MNNNSENSATILPNEDPPKIILVCHNCCNKFEKKGRKLKYCGKKCQNQASLRKWRMRAKPIFHPKNCEWCGEEFVPTRSWNRFCCREHMILYQNNYGRAYHVGKPAPAIIVETFPDCKEFKYKKKCESIGCNNKCHTITRRFPDGTTKIISVQQGWQFIDDILLCSMCVRRINNISTEVAERPESVYVRS